MARGAAVTVGYGEPTEAVTCKTSQRYCRIPVVFHWEKGILLGNLPVFHSFAAPSGGATGKRQD